MSIGFVHTHRCMLFEHCVVRWLLILSYCSVWVSVLVGDWGFAQGRFPASFFVACPFGGPVCLDWSGRFARGRTLKHGGDAVRIETVVGHKVRSMQRNPLGAFSGNCRCGRGLNLCVLRYVLAQGLDVVGHYTFLPERLCMAPQ